MDGAESSEETVREPPREERDEFEPFEISVVEFLRAVVDLSRAPRD